MDPTVILSNPNAFAANVVPLLVVVLAVVFVISLMDRGWYKCNAPGCDFRTRSEVEAAGHQALHGMHKTVPED